MVALSSFLQASISDENINIDNEVKNNNNDEDVCKFCSHNSQKIEYIN